MPRADLMVRCIYRPNNSKATAIMKDKFGSCIAILALSILT